MRYMHTAKKEAPLGASFFADLSAQIGLADGVAFQQFCAGALGDDILHIFLFTCPTCIVVLQNLISRIQDIILQSAEKCAILYSVFVYLFSAEVK